MFLTRVFLLVKLPMLRHILRSGLYPKQVIALRRSPLTLRELETRTERVYHGVNGNPGVSTSENVKIMW